MSLNELDEIENLYSSPEGKYALREIIQLEDTNIVHPFIGTE